MIWENKMFNTIVEYEFYPDKLEEACKIWEDELIDLVSKQPGFIRMQFYAKADGKAMAIGSWKASEYAQKFMQTGVFQKLVEKLKRYIVREPHPEVWTLRCYKEK